MSSPNGNTRISVKVSPGASRNQVVDFVDGVLRVKVAAPPEKGKANKELIEFLSDILNLSKSSIEIIRGHTANHKIIAIAGMGSEEVIKRLLSRK
jgi:uncharacterized protein